jgi:hypothetical protein
MVTNSFGCIATNSGRPVLVAMVTNISKARFSIGPSQCCIKKAIESRVILSLSLSVSLRRLVFGVSLSLSLRQCVSESSSVSLRNQKSTVLAVNYRKRKPVFRRVSVVSGVRSLSLYLVVSCCVSS